MHYAVGVLSFNGVIGFSFISVRLLILKKTLIFISFFFNKSIIPYFFSCITYLMTNCILNSVFKKVQMDVRSYICLYMFHSVVGMLIPV